MFFFSVSHFVLLGNTTLDGYPDAGIVVDFASVANVAVTTVKNCTIGIMAGGSGGSTGLATVYNVTYLDNSTDKSVAYGGQIFGGE